MPAANFVPAAILVLAANFVLAEIFVPAANFVLAGIFVPLANFVLAAIFLLAEIVPAANFVLAEIFVLAGIFVFCLFCCFTSPSQQLWPWRVHLITSFLGKIEEAVNQYLVMEARVLDLRPSGRGFEPHR